MKKLIIILTGITFAFGAKAQQDPMVSQYMFNGLYLNPAYAGSHDYWTSTLSFRDQWVGFDGAPTTSTFSINTPIPETNLGLGISAISDRIGPTEQNTFSGDISYTIRLNEKTNLSFGVKGTASFFSFFDVTEKIAIVIGMFSFGFINELTGSQRNSVLVLGSFFVIGLALLYRTAQYQKNATA